MARCKEIIKSKKAEYNPIINRLRIRGDNHSLAVRVSTWVLIGEASDLVKMPLVRLHQTSQGVHREFANSWAEIQAIQLARGLATLVGDVIDRQILHELSSHCNLGN